MEATRERPEERAPACARCAGPLTHEQGAACPCGARVHGECGRKLVRCPACGLTRPLRPGTAAPAPYSTAVLLGLLAAAAWGGVRSLGSAAPPAEASAQVVVTPRAARSALERRAGDLLGLPAQIEALGAGSPEERLAAAEAIGRLGRAGLPACEALADALEDEDPRVRARVARALGEVGPDAWEAAPRLARTLEDPQSDVALAAAEALRGLGPRAAGVAVGPLTRALERLGPLAVAAARALAAMGPEAAPAVPGLLRLCEDTTGRAAAIQALGAIGSGDPAVLAAVSGALTDPSAQVRAVAARTIVALGPAGARQAAPALTLLLARAGGPQVEARDPADHQALIAVLGALESCGAEAAAAIPPLTALLEGPAPELRQAALKALIAVGRGERVAETVPPLVLALDLPGCFVAAAGRLGELGPGVAELAVPGLLRGLERGSDQVSAAWALSRLGRAAAPALPRLLALAGPGTSHSQLRYTALGALGPLGGDPAACVPVLIEALGARDWTVRESAARALVDFAAHAGPALPALRRAADQDPDAHVRGVATWALAQIARHRPAEGSR